jgi:hypothetical protein
MSLCEAIKYLKLGYRIRRAGTSLDDFMSSYLGPECWADGNPFPIMLNELLADDWEIVLENIVKDFPITYKD